MQEFFARRPASTLPFLLLLALACGGGEPEQLPSTEKPAPPAGGPFTLENVGFATPESVIHDPEADLYLVANINGKPAERDGNGFISRVSPRGEVVELKWIDGAGEGVTLSAPKGMALVDDRLFVTDIDAVRIFDRNTGSPRGDIEIGGATFLNDVASDGAGGVFVSDSGADAVYHVLGDGTARRFAGGPHLAGPNGLVAAHGGLIMVTLGDNKVARLQGGGGYELIAETPAGSLDGVVFTADGRIVVSSWEGSAIYVIEPDGAVTTLVDGLAAPADFGIDLKRGWLLVPLFNDDKLVVRPLDDEPEIT